MNVTIKLCVNPRTMENGHSRIALRITVNRLSRLSLLPYSVLPSNWNDDAEIFIGTINHFDKKYAQNQIEKSKSELIQLIEKLERSGELEDMSAQDLKDRFQGKIIDMDGKKVVRQWGLIPLITPERYWELILFINLNNKLIII